LHFSCPLTTSSSDPASRPRFVPPPTCLGLKPYSKSQCCLFYPAVPFCRS
jgi:hypothetical protein